MAKLRCQLTSRKPKRRIKRGGGGKRSGVRVSIQGSAGAGGAGGAGGGGGSGGGGAAGGGGYMQYGRMPYGEYPMGTGYSIQPTRGAAPRSMGGPTMRTTATGASPPVGSRRTEGASMRKEGPPVGGGAAAAAARGPAPPTGMVGGGVGAAASLRGYTPKQPGYVFGGGAAGEAARATMTPLALGERDAGVAAASVQAPASLAPPAPLVEQPSAALTQVNQGQPPPTGGAMGAPMFPSAASNAFTLEMRRMMDEAATTQRLRQVYMQQQAAADRGLPAPVAGTPMAARVSVVEPSPGLSAIMPPPSAPLPLAARLPNLSGDTVAAMADAVKKARMAEAMGAAVTGVVSEFAGSIAQPVRTTQEIEPPGMPKRKFQELPAPPAAPEFSIGAAPVQSRQRSARVQQKLREKRVKGATVIPSGPTLTTTAEGYLPTPVEGGASAVAPLSEEAASIGVGQQPAALAKPRTQRFDFSGYEDMFKIPGALKRPLTEILSKAEIKELNAPTAIQRLNDYEPPRVEAEFESPRSVAQAPLIGPSVEEVD